MNKIIVAICVDSIESAIAAEKGGADRIELCSSLFEGGITPSYGCIEMVRKSIDININVIIRPRGGDFLYSSLEFEIMKKDILISKELGANGIVLGLLTCDGNVDIKRTKELVELAKPMTVTFHRAFDMTCDPFKALEDIISIGIDRVLTSGQERCALEGVDLLKKLVDRAGNRIIIMPGAGITERNINNILSLTGAREVHTSARKKLDSKMTYRKSHVFMGGELHQSEYEVSIVDINRVDSICKLI
jgi:copper homeostasis protein